MFIPLTTIVPNIIIVHPPSTGCGNVEKNAPIGGNKPARISVSAPNMIVNLFTTFVIAISPTFCENDVIGVQPNNPDTALKNPSHASDPDTSFSVISLSSPPATTAVVSPIVSAADTRKTTTIDKIALILNIGLYGNILGNAMKPTSFIVSAKCEKSTIPNIKEAIYPTISPNITLSCFQNPFASELNIIHDISVISPTSIYFGAPKSSTYPPPKLFAPTPSNENPIVVTTLAETIGEIIFFQYL